MWRFLVLISASILLGCANRPQPHATSPQPTTRIAPDAAHLDSLRQRRAGLAAEVRVLRKQLAKLNDAHPDVEGTREIARREAAQRSESLVAAQDELLDIRSKYAGGHPAAQSATKRVEDLDAAYELALKEMQDLDRLVLERDRLSEQLRKTSEELRRLDDRIAHLEDRRA